MKPWYKSKTNWLNIASIATTIVAATVQILPSLQGLMEVQTYIIINAVVGMVNIVLRNYFTTQAIK